ncbi:COX15/CtaA family protein [Actinotalea sp. K2]|uniref:COX15/CtaA family protein n=1 Tax=Actinotalea sp. K2 TaxID=2939438 RepID=UPI002016FD06|nr:COX15/CtaA family protein [Actinotalea sp. K2]MCL3861967.1 COX15/CtaA family protein [Actinotalea sp. K2]
MSSTTSAPASDSPGTTTPREAAGRPAGPSDPSTRRWVPSPAWARRILLANLVAQVLIVVTGGAVRLTGSGLGCSTWPQCEPGQFAPVLHQATSWHPYIEFGNRTLAGVLAVLAIATAWVVWRQRHRALPYRVLGLVPLLGVLAQSVVGGITVLVELHPAVVGGHFLASMVLIAVSTALVVRHREGDAPPVPLVEPAVAVLARALVPVAVVVLVLGVVVTGSGPHSGDAELASRFALDPALMARYHALSVWVFLAGLVVLTALVLRGASDPRPRRAVLVLLGVTLAQGAIGYVQYLTGLPEVLVGAHMLGAGILVIALVRQLMSMRERTSS